jgi:peptidoglycan/LPS O-acetylase OafA/YrhL
MAYLLYKIFSFYSSSLQASSHQYQSLDGLRGMLALSVMLSHGMYYYDFYTIGSWNLMGKYLHFYYALGSCAVILFFMVTGFLFWRKLQNANGQLLLKNFFIGRIKRIAPMYLFSAALVLFIILLLSNFTINVSYIEFIFELVKLSLLGYFQYFDLNGYNDTYSLIGVYWTLHWEWLFYLFLPILARFVFGSFIKGTVLIIALLMLRHYIDAADYALLFAYGILSAELYKFERVKLWLQTKAASVLAIIILGLVLFKDTGTEMYAEIIGPFGLFLFFSCIVSGNSLFGLLHLRFMRLLGLVSYSVYLIHLIVLFMIINTVICFEPIKNLSAIEYWSLLYFAVAIVVILASMTYRYIEAPFLKRELS